MPLAIDFIKAGSTAEDAGLIVGDSVVSVNERVVRDPLEWRYLVAEEYVEVEIDRQGEIIIFEIEKEYDDSLGIHLQGPGFRRCNNKCIFCFIDQNPRGARKPLRFKDEDFRLSFLYGNYVTLTNTPSEDIDRIIEQRLSPIYVSVHATDSELRRKLLGNPRAPDILPIMRWLAAGEILQHAQIVLMPGINDGPHLDRTLDDLVVLHPWVGSVCIVPVGLTRHRARLPELRAHTFDEARALLAWLDAIQARLVETLGERFVYVSDEFYLLAGAEMPPAEFYEDFPQIGNGVGMVRQLIDTFETGLPEFEREHDGSDTERVVNIDLVTATLAAPFVLEMVARVDECVPGVHITPHVIVNERYGSGITVTGLLCGGDIVSALRRDGIDSDVVLLPPNCVNDEMLFLDDIHIEEVREQLARPVVLGSYELVESVRTALDRVLHPPTSDDLQNIGAPGGRESDGPAGSMRAISYGSEPSY